MDYILPNYKIGQSLVNIWYLSILRQVFPEIDSIAGFKKIIPTTILGRTVYTVYCNRQSGMSTACILHTTNRDNSRVIFKNRHEAEYIIKHLHYKFNIPLRYDKVISLNNPQALYGLKLKALLFDGVSTDEIDTFLWNTSIYIDTILIRLSHYNRNGQTNGTHKN